MIVRQVLAAAKPGSLSPPLLAVLALRAAATQTPTLIDPPLPRYPHIYRY